jgi:hypothetical protein
MGPLRGEYHLLPFYYHYFLLNPVIYSDEDPASTLTWVGEHKWLLLYAPQ